VDPRVKIAGHATDVTASVHYVLISGPVI